jgi:uncharacterized membrane protein
MINLIPKEEKKKMTIDFYYKILVLFFVMAGLSALVALVAILPAYFLSSMKYSLANAKLETQKGEPLPQEGEQTIAAIKDINNKLSLVENAEKNKFPLSVKVINAVLLEKISNIEITEISYENNSVSGKKISITGTAPSREVLLLFREALENSSSFKSVDLPISNFVKGSNIQFYLNLIPA